MTRFRCTFFDIGYWRFKKEESTILHLCFWNDLCLIFRTVALHKQRDDVSRHLAEKYLQISKHVFASEKWWWVGVFIWANGAFSLPYCGQWPVVSQTKLLGTLPCKARRQYLLTLQVSIYCILALQSSTVYKMEMWIWKNIIMLSIPIAYNNSVQMNTN